MITYSRVLGPEFDIFEDDSEETLAGSSIHQGAIVALTEGLDDCAARRDLPWFVGNQLTLVFPRQGERPPAQPAPDICVHPTLTRAPRTSLLVAVDGPPALIIEVTSPSTALKRDLNMNSGAGKPLLYEAIGCRNTSSSIRTANIWAHRSGHGVSAHTGMRRGNQQMMVAGTASPSGSPSPHKAFCCASTITMAHLCRCIRSCATKTRICAAITPRYAQGSPRWKPSYAVSAARDRADSEAIAQPLSGT